MEVRGNAWSGENDRPMSKKPRRPLSRSSGTRGCVVVVVRDVCILLYLPPDVCILLYLPPLAADSSDSCRLQPSSRCFPTGKHRLLPACLLRLRPGDCLLRAGATQPNTRDRARRAFEVSRQILRAANRSRSLLARPGIENFTRVVESVLRVHVHNPAHSRRREVIHSSCCSASSRPSVLVQLNRSVKLKRARRRRHWVGR